MPDMSHRLDRTLWDSRHYAHRGLHKSHTFPPENSMTAFLLAMEKGYGIELDVQITKDRIPVVFHDYSLKRMCQIDKKVKDLTFKELQNFTLSHSDEHIPSLESILHLINGKIPLIIEFKTEGKNMSVCKFAKPILKNYKGLYCIESFNPMVLLWYKKNDPKIIRGQLSEHLLQNSKGKSKLLYFLLQNLLLNFLTKPDFIAYNHKHSYMLSYVLCHRLFRIPTFAWTIQSQEALDRNHNKFDYFIFDNFTPGKLE